MDRVLAWLQAHRGDLTAQYLATLQKTLFSDRSTVRPKMLPGVAETETEALLDFFRGHSAAAAAARGRYLCQVGLSEHAIIELGWAPRSFLLTRLEEELHTAANEVLDAYHRAAIEGFIQSYKEITLEEQERIRSALQRTLNRYTVQMEAAAEVAQAATSVLDLDHLLQVTADAIHERFGLDYVGIFLRDEGDQRAILRAAAGQVGREQLQSGQEFAVPGDSIVAECIAHNRAHISLDVGREDAHSRISPLPGVHSEMAIPLATHGNVIGAVAVQSCRVGAFSDQDVTALGVVARQLANGVENARLFAEVRRFSEELEGMVQARTQQLKAEKDRVEMLHTISTELTSSLDLDDILLKTVNLATEATGCPLAMVLLREPAGQSLVCRVTFDRRQGPQPCRQVIPLSEAPALRQLLEDRHTLYVEDGAASPLLRDLPQLPAETRSFCAIPLVSAAQTVGILLLTHPQAGFFDPDLMLFLSTLGSEVATAIVNAELYGRINEQAGRLERMLAYQQEFVSVISHELRNPLTAIRGYADLLAHQRDLPPLQQESAEVILANVKQQMDLVDDLADISRIETGQITLSPQRLTILELVQEVVQSARVEIERGRLSLEVAVPADLPPVYADRRRILQVLNNLVSNACKYTLEGGRLTVSAHLVDAYVQVDVRDSGVGISQADQQRLFSRFFRANNALRDKVKGTGLGLAISRSFVEMHGGRMWVQSEPSVGSTFSFTLPLADR